MIDLRSDTVTKPTPAMRRAMAEAEVGDDVYGEDPTVNRLEQRAAEIAGKEAALFVPTGTMGNTIGIKLHTQHGQEVICEARCHIFELRARHAGLVLRLCGAADRRPKNGILRWEHIRREIRPLSPHCAPTGVIAIENTHNMAGGTVYPLEVIHEICDGAHEAGLKVHMDGARVFNAAESCGVAVREIVAKVDTVMFCLSKALGAPVGSMLAGPKETIAQARLYRKRLGGGMRQAGVLAAAGLIALEKTPAKAGARITPTRACWPKDWPQIRGIHVDPGTVQSNIVIFDVSGTGDRSRRFQLPPEATRRPDQWHQPAARCVR